MKKRILLCLAVVLMSCLTAAAQDAKMQPLTFWYEYTVNPGKEAQFLELVKTVGAPVRDRLLADGVVLAWGGGHADAGRPFRSANVECLHPRLCYFRPIYFWRIPVQANIRSFKEIFENEEENIALLSGSVDVVPYDCGAGRENAAAHVLV